MIRADNVLAELLDLSNLLWKLLGEALLESLFTNCQSVSAQRLSMPLRIQEKLLISYLSFRRVASQSSESGGTCAECWSDDGRLESSLTETKSRSHCYVRIMSKVVIEDEEEEGAEVM